MGPDQPPGTSSTSTPPSDPLYSLQPASTDKPPFQDNRYDESLLDPSAPSQGTYMWLGMFQGDRLSNLSHHPSMPGGNEGTANFNISNVPHTNMHYDPLSLGTPSQQFQHGNASQHLGSLEYQYLGQPKTIYSFPAHDSSLDDLLQSASSPQSNSGPHPQPQELIEPDLLYLPFRASASFGPPVEAATTSRRRGPVDESEPRDNNQPPSAVRRIELASPRPADGETTVHVRRDAGITLIFDMQSLSKGLDTYGGLKIPSTPSVRSHCSEDEQKLLHLEIRVLGATTRDEYKTVCHVCKDREGDRDAFPDFRSKSNILVPKKNKNGRLLVSFTLGCPSKHRKPRDSEYCLKVILNGGAEQNIPLIEYELPYSFIVVQKLPPRTRNQGEDAVTVGDAAPPPNKRPRTRFGHAGRAGNPVPQSTVSSGLDELSSGDSRGPTSSIPSGTSENPVPPMDIRRPASPAEALMPSHQSRQTVITASDEETVDGRNLVIERINPSQGPTAGGPEIWISGSNFPIGLMPLYVRFGDNFAHAVAHKPDLLSCLLPQASGPGKVSVWLSRSPDPNAPVLGTTLCQFKYFTDPNEMLPVIIRIQEDYTSEVAAIPHNDMKKRNLKRNEKRPLRGEETQHDEMETAIIQALAPRQNTLDFGGLISDTEVLEFEEPMEAIESFRIPGPCEMNTALTKLITLARNTSSSQFTSLQLATFDALVDFATPLSSLFRHLRSLWIDVDAHWTLKGPPFTFDGPINTLESFRIKNPCEDSILFEQLLDAVSNSSHERLVDMELSSPNAIYHLSQPHLVSIFRHLVTFKVDVREMSTSVDILRRFDQLEILEAFRLRLPTYAVETDLPLVRTLKRITIKTVSVQWMAGRTFSILEDCTIIWPHYPETLAPGGGVDLPVCTHFTYDDHLIDTLPNFRIPKLDTLIVRNKAWNKPRAWTRTDLVEFLLERTRVVTLDVEIDTNSASEIDASIPSRPFAALALVAKTSARWRNLTIPSFPKETDLLNVGVLGTGLTFEGPMSALESFRITGPCEMDTSFSKLIDLVRSSKSPRLTTIELSTCDTLYHFAKPPASHFRYLQSFKVDLAEMKDTLDILPQFERLEDLYAHRLQLPLYSDTNHLPLVRTLKRLFLKSTSVQWMQGRSFPKLLECTIIWPHLPEALLSRDPVNLPVSAQFTYDDHLLQPLTAFDLPSLDKLVIRNEAWNRPRGSQQLGFIWGPNIHVPVGKILRPRVLHLDTQCYDQHLIGALKVIPELEELVLGVVRPDALGKKFLLSMLAKKGREDFTSAHAESREGISVTRSGTAWIAAVCPNLKALGLKYRRWLRARRMRSAPSFGELLRRGRIVPHRCKALNSGQQKIRRTKMPKNWSMGDYVRN